MKCYIPNYNFYRTDHEEGHKGGTAVPVKKIILHTCVDMPPLLSVEATGVCMPIGKTVLIPAETVQ
jgi:hypothetical protein